MIAKVIQIMISSLLKQIKKRYFEKYLKDSISHIKNTWNRVKSFISIQKTKNESPKITSLGNKTATDPQTPANTFLLFDSARSSVGSAIFI